MEIKVYKFTTDYIKKLFKDINTNLMRRFNKDFKKDVNGKPRHWQKMEEGQIRELHAHIKKAIDDIIGEFKYIKIPRQLGLGSTHGGEMGFSALTRSDSARYEKLLSETDINRVRDKFTEEAEFQLEEAIRKHHNISNTSVPVWLWVLLFFFAFDNIISWMGSPFIFYPLSIIFCIVVTMFSLGIGGAFVPILKMSINEALRRAGIGFRI